MSILGRNVTNTASIAVPILGLQIMENEKKGGEGEGEREEEGEGEGEGERNKIQIQGTEIFRKIKDYLNTVIIIIIFLIFLNLFITTYFYFTTSIEATANRSNCGGASLCEAETHRHLFLEDNGNDKARDIYIIIVVIFSIYLLSEIFKSYKDGIKFEGDDRKNKHLVGSIIVLFLYFAFIVGTISGIIDKTKSKGDKKPELINVVSSALFMLYLLVLGFVMYRFAPKFKDDKIKFRFIGGTVMMALAIIVVEIFVLAGGSKNDLFKGFKGDDFNLINSKFKANTALHIIFLVFYIIFFSVVVGLGLKKDIKTLHIWGLVFLAFILFTLFTFILLASLDFKNTNYTNDLKNTNYTNDLKNITGSTLGMQYFVLLAPLLISLDPYTFKLKISSNAIKLLVLYYAILFIIYLFYVYFVNHSNETGILPLESFQLYNWVSEAKNEKKTGEDSRLNHKKNLNIANVYFVVILLLILLFISGLNEDPNLNNIIYGIIVFILASYITGIVYLLYNVLFPIQQASFNYKKNLVDINNEISQHIKVEEVEEVEHTIDKNKIRVFKIANSEQDIKGIHERIKHSRSDETTSKETHMKNIRDIFSEISPKGSSYEDYRSQSTDQMQYEVYIYRLFSNWTNTYFKFQPDFAQTIFGDDYFEVNKQVNTYRLNSYKLYNSIILKLPKNKAELIEYVKGNIEISSLTENIDANIFIEEVFKIPKTNNIEYVIKKNYKYVTGEEGEIQKYNVLSDKELDCLYYSSNVTRSATTNTNNTNNSNLETSIEKSINNFDKIKFKITNIATDTGKTTNSFPIYKLNQDIFDDFKNNYNSNSEPFTFQLENDYYSNMLSKDVKSIDKLNPAFYTIGYDYKNYTDNDDDLQKMNKNTAYSIPARYYACSYLNYFPNEDGSMSKVKFAKNIKEDNYNPLNTTATIIDRIAKSYDNNSKQTKIELAPEKFQFLLVFLVILAIILLIFLFNIIKKYFTGDVYTPQMYVLGILGVFLTIFIFGEVIFARIK